MVIASATVGPNSTAAFTLAGASLYDAVPIVIWNPSTQAVYLGGSSLTTVSSNLGFPLTAASISYNLLASDPLFVYTTAGTVVITAQAGRQ